MSREWLTVLFHISVTPKFWWSFGTAIAVFFITAIILWGPFLWSRIQLFTSFLNRFQPRSISEEDRDHFAEDQNRTEWSKLDHLRKHFWSRIIIFLIVCTSIGVFSMASMVSLFPSISKLFNWLALSKKEVAIQPTYSNSTTYECRLEDSRIYIWVSDLLL